MALKTRELSEPFGKDALLSVQYRVERVVRVITASKVACLQPMTLPAFLQFVQSVDVTGCNAAPTQQTTEENRVLATTDWERFPASLLASFFSNTLNNLSILRG